MWIYIAHRRRKTSNALDTPVLSEQERFQWTSERLVTTGRITSFKLSTVKIRWGVWPVSELTQSVTDTHTQTHRQTDRHTQVNLYSVHA